MSSKPGSYQNYTSNGNHEQLNSNVLSAVYKIKQTVNQLTQLHKQLGTPKDSPKLRDNIEEILTNTKSLLTDATSNLRALSKMGAQDSGVAFERTKKELATEVEKYCQIEKLILEKLKKPIPSTSGSNYYNDEANIDDTDNERSSLLKQEQLTGLDERLENLRDRESKIRQIESDILDVNAITRELATMVYEQNSLIDNISSNVDRTAHEVESGNTELVKANRYAAKHRKKILILIMIIIFIAVVLGLIIFLSVRK